MQSFLKISNNENDNEEEERISNNTFDFNNISSKHFYYQIFYRSLNFNNNNNNNDDENNINENENENENENNNLIGDNYFDFVRLGGLFSHVTRTLPPLLSFVLFFLIYLINYYYFL